MSHWAYPGVKVVRSLGLLDGGYENNYRLEEKMSKWRFQNLANKVILKAGVEYPVIEVNDPPSNEEFIINIVKVVDKNVKEYEDGITILKEKGIMTEILEPYFQDKNAQGNAAEVTWLAANLYTFLTSN